MKAKDVQRFFERVVAAFANMVLHHAEGPGHMLRAIARVVKPGGVTEIVDEVKHPLAWINEMSMEGVMFYSSDPATPGYVLTPEGTTVRKPAHDDD